VTYSVAKSSLIPGSLAGHSGDAAKQVVKGSAYLDVGPEVIGV